MTTYRLDLEYEGTRYRGWQEQKNVRTIAGELRRAAEAALGGPVELGGAGRTDAGVHALGQVAHLRAGREMAARRLAESINDGLPPDIHVLAARKVEARFHARHAATSRAYLYQVSRRRTALAKRFVWWVRRPLDAGRVARAASSFEGRHDFAAFCEKPEAQSSTLVVVERAEVATAGDLLLVRVVASHFLWRMVRRLVGALVAVGAGELAEREIVELLERGECASGFEPARATAPPSGLFLERVLYPGEPPLAPVAPAVGVSG